jgi:acyl dehydratase
VTNPNPDPAARAAVPVWNQDVKLYEDYEVGETDRSIRRTISEGELMVFSSLLVDLHPYVADEIYGMGLMAHNNVHTFSYGYDRLRFIKPVFIGDTIYTMRTLLRKEPKYDEMGLFTVSYEVFRADDEQIVLYCEHLQTVKYRDPAAAKGPS